MSMRAPRKRTTGRRPTRGISATTRDPSQDFEGDHPLVARAAVLAERPRISPGQRERLLDQDRQPEVGLDARGAQRLAVRGPVQVGDKSSSEERGAEPGGIEGGLSEAPEADRGQVPIQEGLREVGARNLVQLDSRKGSILPVPPGVLVVDPVIAEAAEIEI